jgi:hypothetical protein
MSNIFNLEKVYAEIRQKHPLLTRTFPTISTQLKSTQLKSTQPKSTQLKSTSFYFYVDLSGIPFNKRIIDNDLIQTSIGNDLIQTSSSSLYDTIGSTSISGVITFSSSNYIGTHSSNSTVYNYDVQNDSSGNDLKDSSGNYFYRSFVQTVYRLPTGTIGISHTPILQHYLNDCYELQYNQIEWAPITFGTGDYINKNGYVAILSAVAPVKLVIVFITN